MLYKVRLPGNPILGEGKPENQNHAIIFTRGEHLQTLDMNQDNYMGESYKMRTCLSASVTACASLASASTSSPRVAAQWPSLRRRMSLCLVRWCSAF